MSEYLPEELEQITISALQDGENGYTLPWAVFIEEGGLCWIRGDYPLFFSPTDEAKLKIRHEGNEIIAAKSTVGDYQYDIRDIPHDEWQPIPLRWE